MSSPARRNSQLAYPPAMEEALTAWLREQEGRHAGRNKPGAVLARTSIPLDLTGMPEHYPLDRMQAMMPSVPLRLLGGQQSGSGWTTLGTWTHYPARRRGLTLYLTPGVSPVKRRRTLQHELRHMVQSLLADAMGADPNKPRGDGNARYGVQAGDWSVAQEKLTQEIHLLEQELDGLGSRSPRARELQNEIRRIKDSKADYYLDPIEYFSQLGDVKYRMQERARGREIGRAAFNSAVADSLFMHALKGYAPDQYRRAVAELESWRAEHNEGTRPASTRPVTTARLISDLLHRLDRTHPEAADEIRRNRAYYESIANGLVTP